METIERAPTCWFIEGVGPELEPRCPTLWHGIGVPGDLSGETAPALAVARWPVAGQRARNRNGRWRGSGCCRRRRGEISIVPDSGFLVPRLFPLPLCAAPPASTAPHDGLVAGGRLRRRAGQSFDAQPGRPAVQCAAQLFDRSPRLSLGGHARDRVSPPATREAAFSTAVSGAMVGVCSMPEALVPPEDVASVIEGARALVSIPRCKPASRRWRSSEPTVIVNLGGRSNLTALAELPCRPTWQRASRRSPSCPQRCTRRWARRARRSAGARAAVRHRSPTSTRMAEVIEQSSSAGADLTPRAPSGVQRWSPWSWSCCVGRTLSEVVNSPPSEWGA